MKAYVVVGWYSYDGSNDRMKPFARVVKVEAKDGEEALELGGRALDRLYEEVGISVDFLNWFVREEKEQQP